MDPRAGVAPVRPIDQDRLPVLFAHRGASALAPENTIEAFRLGLRLGATGLESDVHLARDGTPVLVHDPEIAGDVGRVIIRETPVDALRALGVPTLGDLYEACGTRWPLSLDLNDDRAVETALAVIEVARLAGPAAVRGLLLCHGDPATLAAIRAAVPDVALVHSADPPDLADLEAHLARLRTASVSVLNLHHADWAASGADRAIGVVHRAGLRAFAWDTQAEADARVMLTAGADGVYADDPRVLIAASTGAGEP